jgi:predicted nucleic acid-binding protein
MIVVADTSPINYLVLIEAIGVLPTLYNEVVIPQAVFEELQTKVTPEKVRSWIAHHPSWLSIKQSTELLDPDLLNLDPGEREAIVLVDELHADALIIDDRAGREEAKRRGIFVIGTLGVLNSAAQNNLIDLPAVLDKLQRTSFRASKKLISDLLQLDSQRKKAKNE